MDETLVLNVFVHKTANGQYIRVARSPLYTPMCTSLKGIIIFNKGSALSTSIMPIQCGMYQHARLPLSFLLTCSHSGDQFQVRHISFIYM